MALNIKPLFPLDHPEPLNYVEDKDVTIYTNSDPLDREKDERENRAKDHNYVYVKAKLKINIIS
ncbi:hypothetical protein [Bacteriovorax sp. DB6_IX]|uniref:hypothetical protein n=1 Tax=Bacteriovorax sp. DB6_IX TaxID=1353530 RepID=UPI00038A0EA9|nr:hypothetical protein [Bacteriovorax sp. DB6_IX]EQC48601.1 hypothetical protein M901_1039 [Bacteriovorax sp. DB6_IX]